MFCLFICSFIYHAFVETYYVCAKYTAGVLHAPSPLILGILEVGIIELNLPMKKLSFQR